MKKPLSSIIFSQNGMRQAENQRKKFLVPNSVQPQLGQENFQKNSKKNQKIKKLNSNIISIQKGLREAKKERKKFQSRIPLKSEPGKKIPKKRAKKFTKLKNLFLALFLAKTR